MTGKLKEQVNEALTSVLPITLIVLVLSVLLTPIPVGTILMFLVGAILLIVGMGLFNLGADMSMMPMGEGIGAQMTKTRKIGLIAVISLIMGVIITIAEPDLQVLAGQVPSVPNMVLILTVALGVGVFLVIAVFHIIFQWSLQKLLIGFYVIVFIVSFFVPGSFLAVAFGSGGVTTGPITVPFILAIGLGLASIRSDKESMNDSFGLVALCSIGPILAVLILGIVYNPQGASYEAVVIPEVITSRDVIKEFLSAIPHYFQEVGIALVPIAAFMIIFQLITRRFKRRQLGRIAIGFIYTFVGLVLFLTGVNVGFIPVGHLIGSELAATSYNWILIPLGMLIGYFIVTAEPAVHVLNKQVEEVSGGAIPGSAMTLGLSIGVSISLGLAMVRVLTGISIYWFLIPGYIIALAMTFFTPKMFIGIAFDSGGVVSGPMTSTFLLPFAIGACEAAGGNIMTDAFGIVAMVAMIPLIAIQAVGLVYKGKMERSAMTDDVYTSSPDDIIDYEEESTDE